MGAPPGVKGEPTFLDLMYGGGDHAEQPSAAVACSRSGTQVISAVFLSLALAARPAAQPPAPASPLEKAGRLYEQARYDEALRVLGDDCGATGSPKDCEQLRAFIHVALGQDDEARAAFARLIAADPDAMLPPDVAPKLKKIFDEARRAHKDLSTLQLEPIDALSERGPWTLSVKPPAGLALEGVTVFVAVGDAEAFHSVSLRLDTAGAGDVWSGIYRPSEDGGDRVRYFIESRLAGGLLITAGSSAVPKQLSVVPQGGGGPDGPDGDEEGKDSGDGPGVSSGLSLPDWALWAIIGGAVAVVATGITLAFVLSDDQEPGAIRVRLQFEDDP